MLDAMVAVTVGSGHARRSRCGQQPPARKPARVSREPPHVLTVGALDQANAPAFFSAARRHVDLAAPGVNIPVAVPATSTAAEYRLVFSGTSFASPLVAGAAAWVWTARPTLD